MFYYSLDNVLKGLDVGVLKLRKISLNVVVKIDLTMQVTSRKSQDVDKHELSHK